MRLVEAVNGQDPVTFPDAEVGLAAGIMTQPC
ncbi:hypothetical protein JOF53_007735 [Crossiella equi]|uniref:Uncharacterized protein n=1 Tax=Crossiella equi TaxID=130796 RepID=A0ABS5AQM6_9PSEU|nr:hypothetical protein [Crossiella equi]